MKAIKPKPNLNNQKQRKAHKSTEYAKKPAIKTTNQT